MVDYFDPLVLNTISVMTASREEYNYFKSTSIRVDKERIQYPTENTDVGRKRKHRRIAIMCLMQYIASEKNSYPFHILTGTCIKWLSHSSKLYALG